MKKYELMLIFDENHWEEKAKEVKAMIEESGASNISEEDWKLRDLAYSIAKKDKGHYYIFRFESNGSSNKELEKKLNMDEHVMRHLLMKDESAEIKAKIAKKAEERAKKKALKEKEEKAKDAKDAKDARGRSEER